MRVNAKQFGIPYWQAPTTAHQLTISQAEPITQPSTLTPSLDFKSKIRRKHQTEFFRAHQEPGEVKACKSCFKQRRASVRFQTDQVVKQGMPIADCYSPIAKRAEAIKNNSLVIPCCFLWQFLFDKTRVQQQSLYVY